MEFTLEAGLAAQRSGDFDLAEQIYRATLAQRPDDYRVMHNLASLLRAKDRREEALTLLVTASELAPHEHLPWRSIGNIRRERGEFEGAELAYRQALARKPGDPQTTTALAYTLLALGRYREAWPLYEARRGFEATPQRAPGREWEGQDLEGKSLLIWPEQGLGDQIMMARFVAVLRERGARVRLACHPPLQRLFSSLDAEVVASEARFISPPDYSVLLFSLPFRLGLELDSLPPPAAFSAAPSTRGRIGLVCKGSPAHPYNSYRSLPPSLADELKRLTGGVSLHQEDTGAADLQETANLIAGLDLVISVDTAVAHLAASLGKPTWVLLPSIGTDWRWMRERADTPWYHSMRLFRQQAPGAWEPVLEAVSSELYARG